MPDHAWGRPIYQVHQPVSFPHSDSPPDMFPAGLCAFPQKGLNGFLQICQELWRSSLQQNVLIILGRIHDVVWCVVLKGDCGLVVDCRPAYHTSSRQGCGLFNVAPAPPFLTGSRHSSSSIKFKNPSEGSIAAFPQGWAVQVCCAVLDVLQALKILEFV